MGRPVVQTGRPENQALWGGGATSLRPRPGAAEGGVVPPAGAEPAGAVGDTASARTVSRRGSVGGGGGFPPRRAFFLLARVVVGLTRDMRAFAFLQS